MQVHRSEALDAWTYQAPRMTQSSGLRLSSGHEESRADRNYAKLRALESTERKWVGSVVRVGTRRR